MTKTSPLYNHVKITITLDFLMNLYKSLLWASTQALLDLIMGLLKSQAQSTQRSMNLCIFWEWVRFRVG